MATPQQDQPPQPVDATAREYLQEMNVAPILEAFVTDLVQERPKDVLAFMSTWAQKGAATVYEEEAAGGGTTTPTTTAGNSGADNGTSESQQGTTTSSATVEDADAAQKKADMLKLQSLAVRQSWLGLEQAKELSALAKTFFTVVTAQHGSLKRNLLKDADYEFLEAQLLKLLDGVVKGTIQTEEVQRAAATHALGRGLETRHYHYFITGMLSALSIHLGEDYSAVAEAWRVILTELTAIVQSTVEQETAHEEGDRDDTLAKDAGNASQGVQDSWKSIDDKKTNVGAQFFNLVILQHAVLKRTVFKGVDLDNAAEKLVELLDGVVSGAVSSDFIESLGALHAIDFGLDPEKHGPYFITTMLMVLKISLGAAFDPLAEPWRLVLTGIADAVTRGHDALKSQQTMSIEVGDPKNEEGANHEAGATGDLVKENWASVTDKKQFLQTFLQLITTQHPVVERSLLKGVDQNNLIEELFLPLFDLYISGSLPDADLSVKAVLYGKEKVVQERFYHYVITAMLTTVSMNISKEDFGLSAELWRLKVTHLCDVVQAALQVPDDEFEK